MSPWRLRQISHGIRQGALIAYPTDTIWGLGCHPLCWQAISRLQKLKKRPTNKGLIMLSSSIRFCQRYIDEKVFDDHYDRLSSPQDRPVTWVVKAGRQCPAWLSGQQGTIAIRVTDKKLIQQLCGSLQSPLISTSANYSGRPVCRNSLQVHKYFFRHVSHIVEDDERPTKTIQKPQASKVIDLQTNTVLRA